MIPDRQTRRDLIKLGLSGVGAAALGLGLRTHSSAASQAKSPQHVIARGVSFLRTRQESNGGWSTERSPGITGLVLTAVLKSGVTPFEPIVTKGLDYLEGVIGPNGNLAEGPQANYLTSICLLAFNEAQKKGLKNRYASLIQGGQEKLRGLQWDEGEGKGPDDPFYGGAGYGSKSRPDVSNTSFFLEALRETGVPADDPAMKKAILFLSRCQNLDSEFNNLPFADKVNDGGFIYSTLNGGESMAGEAPGGGLRSYGSMTYSGLKSMVYAGLTMDDPRVKAAYEFIQKNYTLDENPNMGQQGLYYYYNTFAKALAAIGKPTILDAKNVEHDWRAELFEALAKRQGSNGEWVNSADRWMEGDPNLVTSYALLSIASTLQTLKA